MIECIRPDVSLEYQSFAEDLNNTLEISLVTQHPKHIGEAESHLTLEKIFGAEELQHLLLAVGALKNVTESFFLRNCESSHNLQLDRLVVSLGGTRDNFGVLGYV